MILRGYPLSIIVVILYALIFTFTIRRNFSKVSQTIGYGILIFVLVAVVLYEYTRINFTGPLRIYFDIKNGEYNYYATFSSMLLFTTCFMSVLVAFATQPRRWWHTIVWIYIGCLFLFLSLDEYFHLHESMHDWEIIYSTVAAFTSLMLLAIFWKQYPRKQLLAWFIIVGGMATAAAGGLGLEKFVARGCYDIDFLSCGSLPLVEEVLEVLGYGTTVMGMLLFAEQSLPSKRWNQLKPVVVAGIGIWIGICYYAYWVHPYVYNRVIGTPVVADFAASQMVLIGYHLDREYVQPGETFHMTLFWKAGIIPSHGYGYTINLVHPYTGESLVRINQDIINTPTNAWFAGSYHQLTRDVTIPDDIETPVSPLVLINIWRKNSTGYQVFEPDETDRERFGEGSPIVAQMPIISDAPTKSTDAEYNFANGAALLNHAIEYEDSDELSLTFQWSTSETISDELTQLLHLAHENGNDYLIFDQPPFQHNFTTRAWVKGMHETANWEIEIPDDALAGTYTIYTGLYDSEGIRIPVSDSNNAPVVDLVFPIGEITIEDD